MERLGLVQPKRMEKECPGLELFASVHVPNVLAGAGDDTPGRLFSLIEKKLERLRSKKMENGAGMPFSPLVEEKAAQAVLEKFGLEQAASILADEIWSSSARNPMLASHMAQKYKEKMFKSGFGCGDLMSPLLVVQEEMLFMESEGAERLEAYVPVVRPKPEQLEAKPKRVMLMVEEPGGGALMQAPVAPMAFVEEGAGLAEVEEPPAPPRPKSMESADILEIRLVSIREMLRYYFEEHPDDYESALAAALGLVADESGNAEFLEQRVAFEIARVGSWALTLRVLAEVKKEQEKRIGGAHGGEPDPWRMGMRVRAAKKKPWQYYRGERGGKQHEGPVFCPRWGGLGWGVAVGMLASLLSR